MIVAAMLAGGLALETDGRRVHLRGWPDAVLPEVCWSKRWLGWSCPLCGATRSVILLMRGRWEDSWAMQPAGSLVLATALISAAISWGGSFGGQRWPPIAVQWTPLLWASVLILLVFRHVWLTISDGESPTNGPRAHASASSIR